MQSSIARRPYDAVSKKTFSWRPERTATPRDASRSSWNGPPPARIAKTTLTLGQSRCAVGEPGQVRRLHLGRVVDDRRATTGCAGHRIAAGRVDEAESRRSRASSASRRRERVDVAERGRGRDRADEAGRDAPGRERREAAARPRPRPRAPRLPDRRQLRPARRAGASRCRASAAGRARRRRARRGRAPRAAPSRSWAARSDS